MSHNATEPNDDVSRTEPDGDHFVLGGGALGAAVAKRLREAGHRAVLVDDSVDDAAIPVVDAVPTDTAALRAAGLGDAATVVVATRSDKRSLLVAQLVRAHFDEPRVVVLVNTHDRVEPFTDAGHEPVCVTSTISEAVTEHV